MPLKFKLLAISAILTLLLGSTLVLTYYSFGQLNNGFVQVVTKAESGVQHSETAVETFAKADSDMAAVSKNMTAIADGIAKTKMRIQSIEKKIKGISGTLTGLVETVEKIHEDLPEGDAKDSLEDIAVKAGDIQEITKREALVGMAAAVKSMNLFAQGLSNEAGRIRQLSGQLNQGASVSQKISDGNSQILSLSEVFRKDLIGNRNCWRCSWFPSP